MSMDDDLSGSVDYWIGIAGNLARENERLAREKLEMTMALVACAGGRIEIDNLTLLDLPDIELFSEKSFERDSTVYVTRPKRRKTNRTIPT